MDASCLNQPLLRCLQNGASSFQFLELVAIYSLILLMKSLELRRPQSNETQTSQPAATAGEVRVDFLLRFPTMPFTPLLSLSVSQRELWPQVKGTERAAGSPFFVVLLRLGPSYDTDQAALKFMAIFLPQLPTCWDSRTTQHTQL